nr:Rha family transcriptional regulator [Fusobacterium gastrosuis]
MKKITKIITKQETAVLSSRVLAEQLGKRHSDVIESIEKITDGNIRSLKSKYLTNSNLNPLKNEETIYFIESKYKDKKGEYRKEYLLTKDGFILYMFNIQGYNDFKIAYINEYNRMEKILKNKKDPEFLEVEEQGKIIRKIETDTIKNLVEYAKAQGSKNYNKLYTVYSTLTNRIMGINDRQSITAIERLQLTQLENIIHRTINNCMKEGKNYKDIYIECQKVGNESIELLKFNPVLVN